ncbi:MAG: hypothetical protein EBR82_79095, partial [Caulobacteraceae bacterium]|nr:hypothetical protein [Caulobacteraceae bacterium]
WLEEAYKEGGNNTADFVLHRPHKDFPESLARRRMEGGVTTQPTPETDAIFQTIAIGDFCKQEDALKLLRSEMERLERERDEARREAHDAKIMD